MSEEPPEEHGDAYGQYYCHGEAPPDAFHAVDEVHAEGQGRGKKRGDGDPRRFPQDVPRLETTLGEHGPGERMTRHLHTFFPFNSFSRVYCKGAWCAMQSKPDY